MIATRSLIPLLAMRKPSWCLALGSRLPEIVVHAVRGKKAAKGHFHFVTDRDAIGLAISHLGQKAPAAFVIYHRVDGGWVERIGKAVHGVGRDSPGAIGEGVRLHLTPHP